MTSHDQAPRLLLPVGTQVVALVETATADGRTRPRGAVGVIVRAPEDRAHAYRVRFVDAGESSLLGSQLSVRKELRRQETASPEASDEDLYAYVIYRCIVGSRAYGLEEADSDTDRRGIYLPPAHRHWSLAGVPEQLEREETQETYWELQKFVSLALKANPNVLECLYCPLVEHATPLAQELLDLRAIFLSKPLYQTYNGYVLSQFKKLGQDLRTRGTVRWKHAMHLIRLLLSGVTAPRSKRCWCASASPGSCRDPTGQNELEFRVRFLAKCG
jgi:hypothetical protein